MIKVIEVARNLINKQIKYNKIFYEGFKFDKYQKFYFCTNENIKSYINYFDYSNKQKALTVLASGDHMFNLIEKRIKDIDTFDTNYLTKYYVFGLRYAMIRKYNYNEYLNTLKLLVDDNTSLDIITTIINELLPFMSSDYKRFWKQVNEYNYILQKKYKRNLNLLNMLSLGTCDVNYIMSKNSYLSNEENYNKLRNNLSSTNITYKNLDAIKIPEKYSDNYDLILLSNIPKYLGKYFWSYDKNNFIEYINNLKNMLTDDGILFFNYIHDYSSNNITRKALFNYLNSNEHNLINKEIIKVDSDNKNIKDGVIILRKK